jgi:hypothetical protein
MVLEELYSSEIESDIRRHYIGCVDRDNCIFGLEGSQAVPVSPSGRGKAYDQN